jgi:hypothetical protein
MLHVLVNSGPAMQRYLGARRDGTLIEMTTRLCGRVSDLADILWIE